MTINTNLFGDELKTLGYDFYSGVPCSFLKDLINYAINDCEYVMAANEGDAVATCAGAYLGGRKTVFLCQNSGLTNATSPLTSLNHNFQIPVLGFVSLRGEEGLRDEPQHELMGKITTDMLDLMNITWEFLSKDIEEAKTQLKRADEHIEQNKSFFFVVRKGTFDKVPLKAQERNNVMNEFSNAKRNAVDALPRRIEVLQKLNEIKDNHLAYLATTGVTGRELYEVEDARNNLYMVGSMGCVSSIALGLSLVQENKDVVAIDGDGALLMRLGSMSTNAYYSPVNMFHLLLDNHVHDSTGGQATVSHNIDFVQLAASMGYTRSIYLHSIDELETAIKGWREDKALTFAYLRIAPGIKDNLGRPKTKPYEVKERFMTFIGGVDL